MLFKTGLRVSALLSAAVLLPSLTFSQGRNLNSINWPLSGHVVLEDGTVSTQPVIIESVCNGHVRQETTVDPQGGFGFTLGKGSGDNVMNAQTTSAGGGTGPLQMANECVIRASLPGYTSEVVSLVSRDDHHPDLGIIHLRKNGLGRSESPSSKEAPKAARKAFDKAAEAANARKFDEAAKNYQAAVTLFPGYAEAWCQLGQVQMTLKQFDEARKSFNTAIQTDDKYVTPYIQLATLEAATQNWKTVVSVTDRALALSPNGYPAVYFVNAMANYQLHDAEAAEKSARAGIQIDQQNQTPKLHEILASVLLVRGDYASAARELRTYLQISPAADDSAKVQAQIAQLESRAAPQGK